MSKKTNPSAQGKVTSVALFFVFVVEVEAVRLWNVVVELGYTHIHVCIHISIYVHVNAYVYDTYLSSI